MSVHAERNSAEEEKVKSEPKRKKKAAEVTIIDEMSGADRFKTIFEGMPFVSVPVHTRVYLCMCENT